MIRSKRLRSSLLCAALLAGGSLLLPLAYSGGEADEVLRNLQKTYSTIHDATVLFTHHVRYGVTGSEQTFTGTFVMKRGNKYRIELEDQTIVTDGSSVWSYAKSNHQVIVDTYKENPQSFSPDRVLLNVPSRYRSLVLGNESLGGHDVVILKLTPIDSKANLQWMKIWVDRDEWMMKKIQVLEISDNLMTYTIDSMKTNLGLNDSQFSFRAPPGVEVIDLR